MPNWIGDAVMATPILKDIRVHYPDSKITVLCQGAVGQLFTHDPHVNEVLPFQKPNGWIHHFRIFPLIQELRKGEYDTGILLTNSLSSAWWFFRGKVLNCIGFGGRGRSFLLNHTITLPENLEKTHLTQVYKLLLGPLNIPVSDTLPYLDVTAEERKLAQEQLFEKGVTKGKIIVGINPGAAYGSAKCWLRERFRTVIEDLIKNPNFYIVLFGDKNGRKLTDEISKDFGSQVINLAGKTSLRELIAYLSIVDVLLTNDSGPMHIASALNVPVVALFGSTSAIKTGPFNRSLVIHKHVSCSPCYKRVCPIDFKCMKEIESAEVINALKRAIDESH